MTPLKRFLIIFFIVYIVGGGVLNFLLGPPGMSAEFMEDAHNRAEYEHYLEIIKSVGYKLWEQNPELHPPEDTPHLPENIAFVEEFQAREDFQHEMHRRERYKLAVEFFHVIMMTLLIVKLSRRPLMKFLDQGVEAIRTRIAQAESARQTAAERRSAAEEAIERLDGEKQQIQSEGRRLVEQELAEIRETTERSVAHVRQAAEDRAREEEQLAAMQLREALFDAAAARIVERFKSEAADTDHHRLIADFARELEAKS